MSILPPASHRLPWDVLLLVFEEADPSTLAVLGGVSLDFLRATAPILYREVEVTSMEQLETLFCERGEKGRKSENSSPPSRINSLLSLSQLQGLLLDLSSLSTFPNSLTVSTSRFDSTDFLHLDTLRIRYQEQDGSRGIATLIHTYLLPLLSPERCFWSGRVDGDIRDGPTWLWLGDGQVLHWPRLIILDIAGFFPISTVDVANRLAGLEPPSLLRRRVIRLHVASLVDFNPAGPESLLQAIANNEEDFGLDLMQTGSVILVAHSEEEKKELEEAVRTHEAIARWRSIFAVALEL